MIIGNLVSNSIIRGDCRRQTTRKKRARTRSTNRLSGGSLGSSAVVRRALTALSETRAPHSSCRSRRGCRGLDRTHRTKFRVPVQMARCDGLSGSSTPASDVGGPFEIVVAFFIHLTIVRTEDPARAIRADPPASGQASRESWGRSIATVRR